MQNLHDQVGIKPLTRLQLGFSNARESRHNFEEALNPLYVKREMTMHYFLRSHLHNVIRGNLISHLLSIDSSLPTENNETLLEILLFGIRKI